LHTPFVDLGATPLANSLLQAVDLDRPELRLPLRALVCDVCFLVQLQDFVRPETIFNDYVYFSSYSDTWLKQSRQYAESIRRRLGLGPQSFVVEVASNDGYLLKNFVAQGIPCLGIEPAANVAAAARSAGVATETVFFGKTTALDVAARHRHADLIIANNVIAHVPDLNDFLAGFKALLSAQGVVTVEAPHLLNLLKESQFDTIYHEHFSYLSLLALEPAVARHGLEVFDLEDLPTHGGSLRYYLRHAAKGESSDAVEAMRVKEFEYGLGRLDTYANFMTRVRRMKLSLLAFLVEAASSGKTVVAYGAAAKGNTLLNYCGIDRDLVAFVVDRSPHKQGRYLPGSRIPIVSPEAVFETKPDFLLILPWNLKDEIMDGMKNIREWGGRFVWCVPELEVVA
jgi:hypothetical protein